MIIILLVLQEEEKIHDLPDQSVGYTGVWV